MRIRSLLRARLPTLMGAFAPQPSPNESPFSQSRGARACVGNVVASEKGPERVLYRPKVDGADGVSCGWGSILQSYGEDVNREMSERSREKGPIPKISIETYIA
jgi:hypothetical protein